MARRWRLLAVLTFLYGVGAFALLGVSPLSPFLLEGFGLTRFQVGLLVPAVYLGGLVFSVPAGRLADRFGLRLCLAGGLTLGGLLLLAAAGTPTFAAFLACLVIAGVGWSIVNPALGSAIVELFPVRERGLAMGIKQMGQTGGGIAAAFVLPVVAERWGWRGAIVLCGVAVVLLTALGWRPMAWLPARQSLRGAGAPGRQSTWWWRSRPAIVVFFGAGLGLGMAQSAFLSYLPLFATQALGWSGVGAGALLGVAQTGGAAARLGLGAASDRWGGGRRTPFLVLTAALGAVAFVVFAWSPGGAPELAWLVVFLAGAGTLGWTGLYMLLSAELGGAERAGLMTGIGVWFILAGILLGGPLFGLILDATGSYAVAWLVFALLAGAVAGALGITGAAIHAECRRAAAQAVVASGMQTQAAGGSASETRSPSR